MGPVRSRHGSSQRRRGGDHSGDGRPPAQTRRSAHRSHAFCRGIGGRARPRAPFAVARLVPWKGIHLTLRAFAHARLSDVTFRIVGTGADRPRLERLARRLGIEDSVEFTGELTRNQVRSLLRDCLALVHPSLHDSGSTVCLEAMAAGRPVICLAVGGPATQVTNETGFVIPALTPGQSVRSIAGALTRIATDEALRTTLGANAQRRVRDAFTWDERGRILSRLYEHAADRTAHPEDEGRCAY
jgi:glycosyltransferase involved in cell wall biosynthesis